MSYTFIIGLSLVTLLLFKVYECIKRNHLTKLGIIKFGISAALITSFITTGYFFSYPSSLYWFLFSAVIILSLSLSSVLVRNELTRFWALNQKDKVINAFYYSLLLVSIATIF